jgi:hypothetical protein
MPLYYPDVEAIGDVLRQRLAASWREALAAIIDRWRELERGGRLNANTMRMAVQDVLSAWPDVVATQYDELIDRIFALGFAIGVEDTGVRVVPDHGDQMVLDWLKENEHGFIPALRGMAADNIRQIERIIEDAYKGQDQLGEEAPFDLDDMVRRVTERVDIGDSRAELIVRTETAKATALGRIAAWGKDALRDWYHYHWIATPDDRVKDVSLLFEREGPYTWEQIRHRWEVDHNTPVLVRNRHTGKMEYQTSAFNCRCTVARTPKEPLELFNEGKISRQEYEDMMEEVA